MTPNASFEAQRACDIAALGADNDLARQASDFMLATLKYHYTYNFNWLGRPVIQFPQDLSKNIKIQIH